MMTPKPQPSAHWTPHERLATIAWLADVTSIAIITGIYKKPTVKGFVGFADLMFQVATRPAADL